MSQRMLGKTLGWPQSRIAYVEHGTRRLDVIEFMLMVRALGIEPAKLMADLDHLTLRPEGN